jgi:hypothetical protein
MKELVSMPRKLIRDRDKGDFFVGYLDTPDADRRFLLGLAATGVIGAVAGGFALARSQTSAGDGYWDAGTVVTLTGYLDTSPYPVIRTRDIDGSLRTVLLGCETKCGAQAKLDDVDLPDERVTVRGTILQRDRHLMLAVPEAPDWIVPAAEGALAEREAAFEHEDMGDARLSGEILDSKCWFGAMRPSEGSVHKACAMLCIAGGMAPYFYPRTLLGHDTPMMLTDQNGGALVQPIMRYVADRVRVSGRIHRIEDLVQFRVDVETLGWV